jgi:penicillin-binding protein 2
MRFDDPFPIKNDGFLGLGRVGGGSGAGVIGDAYVDSGISAGGPGSYIGLAVDGARRALFFAALGLMTLTVVARAAQVQLADYAAYASQAEGNRTRTVRLETERGVIYDRGGRALVRNVPTFTATVVPSDLPSTKDHAEERREALTRLSAIVAVPEDEIERRIAEFDRYRTSELVVAEDLTQDQAVLLEIEAARTPGIELRSTRRREYLETDEARSLAHVLGYEGRITQAELDARASGTYAPSDVIGKTGLERQYEAELRGTVGTRRVEIDATGREKTAIAETEGVPGKNLVLAIDLELQAAAEKALRDELRLIGRKRGSAIATDPRTGEILALVSEPSFDANLFSAGISQADYRRLADDPDHPLFPRAIAATLASGSVFKPVVGAAAIDEKIVTPSTSFLSSGGLRVGQWFFPDWKAGGHGITDLAKAIAESVNTYFYIVGGGYDGRDGLGVDRIAAYARKFGFGSPTGIDLPGEGAGFVPSAEWKERVKDEVWYIGDTYHLAIGQGDLLVTPLQINMMTAAFANGGDLMRPHVVNALTGADGTRGAVPAETLAEQVVSPEAVAAVRRGMRQAVTAGSARSLGDLPVAAAAKTGTAQWSSSKPTHAWFTSFAPYDAPEIAVTVMIEEGGEGSATAAPVAKAILKQYFAGRAAAR